MQIFAFPMQIFCQIFSDVFSKRSSCFSIRLVYHHFLNFEIWSEPRYTFPFGKQNSIHQWNVTRFRKNLIWITNNSIYIKFDFDVLFCWFLLIPFLNNNAGNNELPSTSKDWYWKAILNKNILSKIVPYGIKSERRIFCFALKWQFKEKTFSTVQEPKNMMIHQSSIICLCRSIDHFENETFSKILLLTFFGHFFLIG